MRGARALVADHELIALRFAILGLLRLHVELVFFDQLQLTRVRLPKIPRMCDLFRLGTSV